MFGSQRRCRGNSRSPTKDSRLSAATQSGAASSDGSKRRGSAERRGSCLYVGWSGGKRCVVRLSAGQCDSPTARLLGQDHREPHGSWRSIDRYSSSSRTLSRLRERASHCERLPRRTRRAVCISATGRLDSTRVPDKQQDVLKEAAARLRGRPGDSPAAGRLGGHAGGDQRALASRA